MKRQFFLLACLLILVLISGCDVIYSLYSYGKEPVESESGTTGTVTDINGNVYHTVIIGTQTWMVENLKTTKYRNGDPIPNVTDATQWSNLTTGAFSDYNNTPSNSNTYGHLYNWYAVSDSQNIAPTGWHVPTDVEWITLTRFLGGKFVAGYKLKESRTTHWRPGNYGINKSGFTALPGGQRTGVGTFKGIGKYGGEYGFWWSVDYAARARPRELTYDHGKIIRYRISWKENGFSVRCVKD